MAAAMVLMMLFVLAVLCPIVYVFVPGKEVAEDDNEFMDLDYED